MTTGDISHNIKTLQRDLRLIKFPDPLNTQLQGIIIHEFIQTIRAETGDPKAFLPILHFALILYSRLVSNYIREEGFYLAAKTDYRFIECSFKLLVYDSHLFTYNIQKNKLNVKTCISVNQFFTTGFAERKVLLCSDVIRMVRAKHVMLSNEEKKKKLVVKVSSQQQFSTISNEIQRNCDVKPEDLSHIRVERPEHKVVRVMKNQNSNVSQQQREVEESQWCQKPEEKDIQFWPQSPVKVDDSNPQLQQQKQQEEEEEEEEEHKHYQHEEQNTQFEKLLQKFNLLELKQFDAQERHKIQTKRLNDEIILLKNRVAFLQNNNSRVANSFKAPDNIEQYRPPLALKQNTYTFTKPESHRSTVSRESEFKAKSTSKNGQFDTTDDFIANIKSKFEKTQTTLKELSVKKPSFE